jgi:hypothetical protein
VIRAVHISNYRSVGPDASLEFPAGEAPRLVTLAGANNVGKSNVLDALRLVRDVLRDGPVAALHRRGGFRGVRRFGCDDPVRIVLEAEDSEGVVFWGLAQGVEDERLPYWFDWGCVLSPAQAAQLAVQVEDMYRTAADTGRPQPRAALLYDILRARPFASTLFPLWLHGGSDGPHPTPSTSRGVRVGLPLWAERDPLWGRFYASLLTMRMYHPWPPPSPPADVGVDAGPEDAGVDAGPADTGPQFTPPTRIVALSGWTPVRREPRRDARAAGYLRAGAVLDVLNGPHGRDGCVVHRGHPEGGWYRVEGGYVCVGGAVAQGYPLRGYRSPTRADLDASMPYPYAINYGRTILYRRLPTEDDLRLFEPWRFPAPDAGTTAAAEPTGATPAAAPTEPAAATTASRAAPTPRRPSRARAPGRPERWSMRGRCGCPTSPESAAAR